MLSGGMSPSCQAQIYGHQAAQPVSSLPSPVRKTGFSVQLPRGDDWHVVRNTRTAVAIGRQGEHSDESYIVSVHGFDIPELASPLAFQQFVDKQRADNTNPDRFTVLTDKETLIENGPQGALCLNYQTTAIDHDARVSPTKHETLHTTNVALACRSPRDSHLGVALVYSYRYHSGDADQTLKSKLNALVSTLRFEPVENGQSVKETK